MKIESVEAIPLEMPLKKVFSGSGYRVTSRNTIVTRIRTAGGLQSEVYNGDNRAHRREIARIVEDELAPAGTRWPTWELVGAPAAADLQCSPGQASTSIVTWLRPEMSARRAL